jgi:hypothetical protein
MDSIREFHPEKISRQSEVTLWSLAVISLAAFILLRTQSMEVSPWYIVLIVLMLLLAAGTTLSNWMNRRTALILKPGGLEYRNGLRELSLGWEEISEVQVFPTRWGKQAHVVGQHAHFSFRTKSELIRKGEIRSTMGFAHGEHIIEQILKHSGLQELKRTQSGQYYARP